MPELTTEAALTILIDWLQGNIDCDTDIIFDNDEDNTDSATLLPHITRHCRTFAISIICSFCNRPELFSRLTRPITHV